MFVEKLALVFYYSGGTVPRRAALSGFIGFSISYRNYVVRLDAAAVCISDIGHGRAAYWRSLSSRAARLLAGNNRVIKVLESHSVVYPLSKVEHWCILRFCVRVFPLAGVLK